MTPKAKTVVDKVLALRQYTLETGFFTTRSQNELIQSLDGVDLADALLALRNRKDNVYENETAR